ncbi:hypothetical protein Tco_1175661 [Tanacetum coccineum]
MVNNLDAWNSFPWGKHVWRQLYDSIRNVSSKHKHEHLAVLGKNPNHVPSYSLTDTDFRVFLCIGSLVNQSARNHPESFVMEEKAEYNKFEYFGDLFHKAPIELASTKVEIQSNWRVVWQYLNKRSAARAGKKKSSEESHTGVCGRKKGREAALIDRASLYPGKGFGKEETLKKVGLQIEDFLHTTSEDEPDIKDDTSPK